MFWIQIRIEIWVFVAHKSVSFHSPPTVSRLRVCIFGTRTDEILFPNNYRPLLFYKRTYDLGHLTWLF